MISIQSERKGIELVPRRKQAVIENLMQLYLYDFTKYLDISVNDKGLFPPYPDLDDFWKKRDRKFPFLIKYDGRPAGFALIERVTDDPKADYYMTEFFIMQKYRRSRLGTWAATRLFEHFQGRWKVTQVSINFPAQAFWRKVIEAYTGGNYEEVIESPHNNPSQYFQSKRY